MVYMFMISSGILILYFYHLLLTMIGLEFIMVSVMFNMYYTMIYMNFSMYNLIFFLSMMVCEGALGLSLIVLMVRVYGNDYFNSLSILKW